MSRKIITRRDDRHGKRELPGGLLIDGERIAGSGRLPRRRRRDDRCAAAASYSPAASTATRTLPNQWPTASPRRLRHRHAGRRRRRHDVHHRFRDPAAARRTPVVTGRVDGPGRAERARRLRLSHGRDALGRALPWRRRPTCRPGRPELQGLHGARGRAAGDGRRASRASERDERARRTRPWCTRRMATSSTTWLAEARAAGRTKPVTHAETRPEWTEAEATSRAIWLAESVGAPLFVVHVSCRRAADEVARARARGVAVRAETCTHYLTLSTADLRTARPRGGPLHLLAAAPRRRRTRTDLWNALREDSLQSGLSDHCPYTDGQKRAGLRATSRCAPPGLAGIQHRLSLLWERRRARRPHLAEPTGRDHVDLRARTFGLFPRKGTLAPGRGRGHRGVRPRPTGAGFRDDTSLMNVDYDLWEGQTVTGVPRFDALPR